MRIFVTLVPLEHKKVGKLVLILYKTLQIQSISNITPLTCHHSMQDQQTCHFWFKITPTGIIPNGKPKTTHPKSILIKLSNKQAKCKCIGQPIEISVQVLYSKTLNKYCPMKGIIKVYDINKDGSQTISCVGAFNTEELLLQKQRTFNLEIDIGPCKIHLVIEVKKLNQQVQEKSQVINNPAPQKTNQIQKQTDKQKQKVDDKTQNINKTKNLREKLKLKGLEEKKFLKSPKVSEPQCNSPTPYMMDDSCQYGEQISKSRGSDRSDEIKRKQKQMIGEQLIEERRKNKILDQKLEKLNIKIQLLRKIIGQKNNQIKLYNQNFSNFTLSLDTDVRGQYTFEMNQKKRQMSLRYKPNIKFKQIFQDFIQFMIRKMAESQTTAPNAGTEQQTEMNKILEKIERLEEQKKKFMDQNLKFRQQIQNLKEQKNKKTLELETKQIILKKKVEQIKNMEERFYKLHEEKKNLQGLYQYQQERDSQMELIINNKQSAIENLKKVISKNNIQLDNFANKNEVLIKKIDNLQLMLQEMKQENWNLSETIESYREKYGDLKAAKDKTLQRQLKQCLRWIDQQNRDQQMDFEDTTLELSQPHTSTVNSIMKSIGEIENMPLEQISLIRKEVINVLKRLDEFVARNSLAGMSSS